MSAYDFTAGQVNQTSNVKPPLSSLELAGSGLTREAGKLTGSTNDASVGEGMGTPLAFDVTG
ncbi:hypothetical protein [Sulfoacidibacillus ferrooxidans]|uniref:hypothetical protein n=1 Tax=Sulfoacidibacillus ferrooxidans TaxID=2005001 RepID=UPI001F504C68|nr:hypothetical protein [Sulfoacidibacillus ferrooxidans]